MTEHDDALHLCPNFKPNTYYKPPCGPFCVREYCAHWVKKEVIMIDCDPAGNTYEIIEGHCGLTEE